MSIIATVAIVLGVWLLLGLAVGLIVGPMLRRARIEVEKHTIPKE